MALIHNQAGTNILNVNADGSLDMNLAGISTTDIGGGELAINVAQSATHFELSAGNSTVVQLAAGATFTGIIEEIINQQAVSFIGISDLNGTLTLTQYVDGAGTRISNNWTFSIVGGVPFSKAFTTNGNYFRVIFVNNGGTATSTFTLNTYYGTIHPATNLGNMPVSLDEMGGVALTTGQKTRALSIPTVEASQATYMASFAGLVTATAGTDVFTIVGSASKTIKVLGLYVSGTQTITAVVAFHLIKRSTANTGGTSTTPTAVPLDSTDATASAVVRAYTANPSALGTSVGLVLPFSKLISTANFTNSDIHPLFIDFTAKGMKEVTLRGAAQTLSLSLNGVNLIGNSLNLSFIWTEE